MKWSGGVCYSEPEVAMSKEVDFRFKERSALVEALIKDCPPGTVVFVTVLEPSVEEYFIRAVEDRSAPAEFNGAELMARVSAAAFEAINGAISSANTVETVESSDDPDTQVPLVNWGNTGES